MTQEEIKRFKRFLKENGVYATFFRFYEREVYLGDTICYLEIGSFLRQSPYSYVFQGAFDWSRTRCESIKDPEKFWATLEDKWIASCINKIR